ncbi:PUA-domain protein [Candidatus Methanoperedens nitroreducens]|uniref:PUA-domain protein n=1 Tax=Candidatus Methanoperedens nitratireducens TaxID=1392998 RepID=A0A062V592_9EURY|nr:RNA-binding protein [Candidatus Methanoperedens nitroreducens]KCZ70575.1 PUA-domain protein [Candidatus Methanoperedens nitroreducens]MDJ1420429.1 RNA-binding protein [Candidatus Methanoperedens sp.]
MRVKSRNILRKTDEKALINDIIEAFGDASTFANKKLEYVMTDKWDLILVNGEPLLFKFNGKIFPTVRGALKLNPVQRRVMVDPGAVRFIINGADVMGRGIVEADPSIKEGDLVIVVEQTHGKALSIGKALVPGKDMAGRTGKAVKSIHYVGDELWKFEQK